MRNYFGRMSVSALIMLGLCIPATTFAQGITSQQADEILKELRAIRQLLQQPPAPTPQRNTIRPAPPVADERVRVPIVSGYVLGKIDAPVTLVEFTDLECPFCARFHQTTFEEIKKNYIDTGKVRYITRDYPLPFHPNAMRAALATRCAADQGKFWELRHAIIANAEKLAGDTIINLARDLKINEKDLAACIDAKTYDRDVQRDMADAAAAGVSGTPTFVVGRTAADAIDGVKIVGAQPYAAFDARLKELLAPPKR